MLYVCVTVWRNILGHSSTMWFPSYYPRSGRVVDPGGTAGLKQRL